MSAEQKHQEVKDGLTAMATALQANLRAIAGEDVRFTLLVMASSGTHRLSNASREQSITTLIEFLSQLERDAGVTLREIA